VPVDERQRIFERFVHRDDAHSRTSGAGLGLAIAREITHAHGGEIWVEDHRPNGARFTVALPAAVSGDLDQERFTASAGADRSCDARLTEAQGGRAR
jgi:signal transduction histidine kinase